jgi:hypothetical protein
MSYIFGDWELVLASYNSGPGLKAIDVLWKNRIIGVLKNPPKKHKDMFRLLATIFI